MQDNLDELRQRKVSHRILESVEKLEERHLKTTLLGTLRTTLEGADGLAHLVVDAELPQPMPVDEFARSQAFQEALRRVYDSWLAQRITFGDAATVAAHLPLLRAAAVVLEWMDRPSVLTERPLTEWLESTIIVTPRAWTVREQARQEAAERRASKPNGMGNHRRVVAGELRARLNVVTTGLEAIREVRNAIVEARAWWANSVPVDIGAAERAGGDVDDPPESSQAGQQIRTRLATTLEKISGIPRDIRSKLDDALAHPESTWKLFNDLDRAAATDDSSLCAEIQAVERAIQRELPPAPAPVKPETPPLISSVGIGDLIVVRERLVGYEANEIARIENVLPGEVKRAEYERRLRTDTTTETETTTDTQTTDRTSDQQQTSKQLESSLSVDTGVNVSAQYGVTAVNASLDAAFHRSMSAATTTTSDEVHQTIGRTVERSREVIRDLRRTVTVDEIRSTSEHCIDNTKAGVGGTPSATSGVYRWVDKVQEIELRRYGKRLMIEFHIPEPAVSILESQQLREEETTVLPPFDVRPADLNRKTYRCLAQRYGANLSPPPSECIDIPFHHASNVDEEKDTGSEDVITGLFSIPDGYRPVKVTATVTASPHAPRSDDPEKWKTRPYITVAVGSATRQYKNGEGQYSGPVLASEWPEDDELGYVTGTAFFPDPLHAVEQGVPISACSIGAFDNAFTVHAVISAQLTDEAWQAWQMDGWWALRQAHQRKTEDLARQQEREQLISASLGTELTDRPPAINRRTERSELKKWAIKAMRQETFDSHPIVTEFGLQEPDVSDTHAQAPVMAFFEDAFEWRHMTYLFYPYYWSRRDTWELRRLQRSGDHLYEAFLQAGAARVIVAVTPGYEQRVLCYLNLNDAELQDRIPGVDLSCPDAAPHEADDVVTPDFYDIGLEILTERHVDLVRGSGTLSVVHDEAEVSLNDSLWTPAEKDLGRELQIDGAAYDITGFALPGTLVLDRPFEGATAENIQYAVGSVRYGNPWQIRVPTSHLVLKDEAL